MSKKRYVTSFLVRVWQEPSEWQPPGEWRVSVRSMQGGEEVLFSSAEALWRHLTDENAPTRKQPSCRKTKTKGEEKL